MAFAVSCKSCQARFLLNDDLLRRKVAGRVVTVRCRQCHATIEVDASEVDPKTLPEAEKPAPPKPAPKALKPTPSPPRPTNKSTLMGIGAPRPGAATELVALSPGLLNMSVPSPTAPAAPGARGFPEPPPPPSAAVEELSASDWEITETPTLAKADDGPESVDDFIEELPPSLPPPDEELPSSTGTPSLQALAHHDDQPQRPRTDDFLVNMSAAMNGGIMPSAAAGAPTIDVSAFATEPAASEAPSIDVSLLDVPIEGKQTLPLFALTSDASAPGPAPAAPSAKPQPPAPHYARPAPSPSGGSLSPSAVDRPARESDESPRERKNVVAPATNSTPPAAPDRRRSGLAAPVLLALAVAAGFLIWKRSSGHADALAQAEQSAPAVEAPRAPTPLAPTPEATLAIAPAAPAPAAPVDDDVTFETAPSKPAAAAAVVNKPSSTDAAPPTTPAPVTEKPAVEKPVAEKPAAEAKPEPAAPAVKEPSAPSGEPAGPFDRAAASAALNSSAAQASSCRKEGDPSGVASVTITFAPSGRVTSANISGPPFAGTPTGGCIAAALRKARVPAFEGDRVTVSKTVVIQ